MPTDQELNAYVDGELSPRERASVAEAIARSPEIAARVATLTRLKSALAEPFEAPEDLLPKEKPRNRAWRAIAACAAVILVVSATAVLTVTHRPAGDAWFEVARAGHAAWLKEPLPARPQEPRAGLFLASLNRLGGRVHVPDLTSAKLRLTYLRLHPGRNGGAPALHLGYTGRRGCRLTLWVTPVPDASDSDLKEYRNLPTRAFYWRSGGMAYAVIATGMAERRFTMIARMVYATSLRYRDFDKATRLALRRTSDLAPPCQA